MNKTFKKASVLGALGIAVASIATASAMSFGGMMGGMNNLTADEIAARQTTMFQTQAALIGATVDDVKNAWANGTDFLTLAKSKGVTEEQLKTKMQAQRVAEMKTQLDTLVAKGVITQAQADKRLATMQTKMTNKKSFGMHGYGGMRGMMGF